MAIFLAPERAVEVDSLRRRKEVVSLVNCSLAEWARTMAKDALSGSKGLVGDPKSLSDQTDPWRAP